MPPLPNPDLKSKSKPTLIYPSAPSPHHTCLPTFLAYAARTNLDPASTVYVGTHYEYTTSLSLARYGLDLRRVGGSSDFGIDLLGTWSLPSTTETVRAKGAGTEPVADGVCGVLARGKVEQFLWNQRAEAEGLEGLGVGMKYVVDAEGKEDGRELVLTWKGRNLAFGGKGKTAG
ncbi:hypothetical protein N0V88_003116 [Collariella sp. IMI 366227]|nr:hypothetical protein N0V88_003116 [Collariella sp. IMI 366227]